MLRREKVWLRNGKEKYPSLRRISGPDRDVGRSVPRHFALCLWRWRRESQLRASLPSNRDTDVLPEGNRYRDGDTVQL